MWDFSECVIVMVIVIDLKMRDMEFKMQTATESTMKDAGRSRDDVELDKKCGSVAGSGDRQGGSAKVRRSKHWSY